ncbi:MAG: reverse transcriptase domain-containing protein [Oscillospiraceae bacterium]
MSSTERRNARYQRRKAGRAERVQLRSDALGGLPTIFSYHNLFYCGTQCCNGVRWKQSTQRFECHLFSGTARRRKQILTGKWKFGKYVHFMLSERGKTRPIDAPHIADRQIHKALCRYALEPVFTPSMIYDNGASQRGKGLSFSIRRLKEQLRWFYRRYGREGYIWLGDFHQFFPSAEHSHIYARHEKLLKDEAVRKLADSVVATVIGGVGMPLGVEPSQLEMVSLPSPIDNWMKCQMRLHSAGHYMDDYTAVLKTRKEAEEFEAEFIARAEAQGLNINRAKCHIIPLDKPFKFCKAKFTLTATGQVKINGNSANMRRARRKLNSFKAKVDSGKMSMADVEAFMQSQTAYFGGYNDHGRVLRLRRVYHAIYGGGTKCIKLQ